MEANTRRYLPDIIFILESMYVYEQASQWIIGTGLRDSHAPVVTAAGEGSELQEIQKQRPDAAGEDSAAAHDQFAGDASRSSSLRGESVITS